MAQWVNRLRNNIFVNQPPLSREISGALHLVQPGLTEGRQTNFKLILKFSKFAVD